jgi:tyrosinase
MKNSNFFLLVLLLAIIWGFSNCAVNPRCPNQLMPVVEVQINNTASNHDDYANTSTFIPCRARIVNTNKVIGGGLNFPGGVEVEVRNRKLSTDLRVSPVNSGTSTQFFATLPANGGWLDFFIRGNTLSSADKSAILELATAGATCNEVVLSRKGLMVVNTPPIPASGRPQVEIEVGSISCLDDYITWSPTNCRVKWINPPSASATLGITLRNMPGTNRLRFANAQPAAGSTATSTTTTLTLSGDGAWQSFYIAGNNGNPSINDKDAVLEVLETSSNNLLAREGVMVRIRKNANAISAGERDRYLEALRDVHQTYDFYMLFRNSHSQNNIAHLQAHSGSAFLPWHRAFVLHFERLLQSSDPSIAVPYWHFDQSSPNMFNANFIGANPTAPNTLAILNASNPISSWQIPSEIIGIRRRTPYGDSGTPGSVTGTGTPVITETATLGLGTTFQNFKTMENQTHNGAHNNSGNTVSWIGGSPAIAPQDPLFYFLHSNVDRLWAKWQWVNNRFDPTQANAYDRQGSFTSPGTPGLRLGQYVEDTMWPWDNVTGGTGTAQRPANAPLTPFPIVIGGLMPGSTPTVRNTIDFRLMNFAYDDVFPY